VIDLANAFGGMEARLQEAAVEKAKHEAEANRGGGIRGWFRRG
jgi:hypothetical protein